MVRDVKFPYMSALNNINFLSCLAHSEFNRAILLHGIVHSGKGVHTVPIYELLVVHNTNLILYLK